MPAAAPASAPAAVPAAAAPEAAWPLGALAELGEGRLVHLERLPARPARYGELARPLPAKVRDALGVDRLYSHQAAAIDLVRSGVSTAIAAGTDSGKSLCYAAPIAEAACAPVRAGTSLLIFPTKALAQDQLGRFASLGLPRVMAASYDGDASRDERANARSRANVVLTNPEMLHHGILPNHRRWATFLARLRYVVVDELHVLRGIFGSHVAHVLRRLRRLCAFYGSEPVFVFTSATIGSPGRLASQLCGLEVSELSDDGSPRAERWFALWNPPRRDFSGDDDDDLWGPAPPGPARGSGGGRVSAGAETARVAAALIESGRRTIAFCRSRRSAELVALDLRRRLPSELEGSVRAYRGGYLADERREIEAELHEGRLQGVVTTSALELGVDVGGLDAAVLAGYPGTIASLWQQAGRAGRGGAPAAAVLIGSDNQLDQWLMRHPEELFTRPPEEAVINPANPHVLLPHLQCAAFERPLEPLDARYWGDDLDEGVRRLALADRLHVRRWGRGGGSPVAAWSGSGWPSQEVGLRSASSGELRIVEARDGPPIEDPHDLAGADPAEGRLVGTVDAARALHQVHDGAIYLHQGAAWRVERLDLDRRVAWVRAAEGDEHTRPRTDVEVRILAGDRCRQVGAVSVTLGDVEVISTITGYQRVCAYSRATLGVEALDAPPSRLTTRAVWWCFDPATADAAGLTAGALGPALHAAEHAAIGILPLFTICDRWDVGGVSTALQADTGRPTIVIYDGYAGGAGIAELAFEAAPRHLAATLEVIAACACRGGCPSCVHSPKCGNGNDRLDKAAAQRLLAAALVATAPTAG